MSPRLLYRVLLLGSITAMVVALIAVYLLGNPWQTLLAGIAGAFASLAASTFIQNLASDEQALMLREITLTLPGISALPSDFHKLQWLAYTTRVSGEQGRGKFVARVARLKKMRTLGANMIEYEWIGRSPHQKIVRYPCTFIGLVGCVLAIIGKPGETSSVVVLDVPVPDVGTYFGAGYITNWLGSRNVSIHAVGTTPLKKFSDLKPDEIQRFKGWFATVEWSVDDGFKSLTEET